MSNANTATTYAGAIPGLTILVRQITFIFDSNPETVFNPDLLAAGIGMTLVGFFSLSAPFFLGKMKG